MECRVDKTIAFKWNTLFQAFQTKEFQVLLQYDPSIYLKKWIHKNILKSGLHREAMKNPVLPCPDVIERMTRKIGNKSRTILNFEAKHVASYQDPVMNQLYHFKESQVKVTP